MLTQAEFEAMAGPGGVCDCCAAYGLNDAAAGVAVWQTREPVAEFATMLVDSHVYFCQDCYSQCLVE
jgi:hypothetical protein